MYYTYTTFQGLDTNTLCGCFMICYILSNQQMLCKYFYFFIIDKKPLWLDEVALQAIVWRPLR